METHPAQLSLNKMMGTHHIQLSLNPINGRACDNQESLIQQVQVTSRAGMAIQDGYSDRSRHPLLCRLDVVGIRQEYGYTLAFSVRSVMAGIAVCLLLLSRMI